MAGQVLGVLWPATPLRVLVPMLGRRHLVEGLAESLHDTVSDARLTFLCSEGDEGTADVCALFGDVLVSPPRSRGDYAAKINNGVRVTDEPLLFFGAIDIKFQPGWFEAATGLLDGQVQVVGTNDLANPRVMRGDHATHFLLTRDYAEQPLIDGEPGPLFEGYVHEFVDDEFLGTAMKRGRYAFAADSHVRHHHPQFDSSVGWDESYRQMNVRMRQSLRLFQYRRQLWM